MSAKLHEPERIHLRSPQGDNRTIITDRLRVPGGWLYRTFSEYNSHDHRNSAVATTFVPDAPDEIKASTTHDPHYPIKHRVPL